MPNHPLPPQVFTELQHCREALDELAREGQLQEIHPLRATRAAERLERLADEIKSIGLRMTSRRRPRGGV
jgi:hypothetical protein